MRFLAIILALVLWCLPVYPAVTVTVNGSNHTIPQTNEKGWGTNVTAWIQAISQYTLQPNGGTFSLTAEVNTGSTYGFKVPYIKTATSTPSTAGVLRLANTDTIGWRDAGNSANLALAVDASDQLTFNGVVISTTSLGSFQDSTFDIYDNGDPSKKIAFQASGITTETTRTITVPDANVNLGALTNSNIDASAAIVDTKLDTIATAGKVSNSATTATDANTNSAIVARDGSGNFSAGTITAALSGNASTATALAANPSDCGANTFAQSIAADGDLTCNDVDLATADVTGVLTVAKGGTGIGTISAGALLVGFGSTSIGPLAIGSTSQILTVVAGAPSWQNAAASPPGMVITTASTNCPSGTLHADGSAVSRATYSALFTEISTTYGVGDGSTTFNLPNTQGVFIRGEGSQTISTIGYTGTQGTTQGDQVQGHYHTTAWSVVGPGSTGANVGDSNSGSVRFSTTQSVLAPTSDGTNGTPRTGSETRPANIVLKYCIYF